jgi:hypothetical protein
MEGTEQVEIKVTYRDNSYEKFIRRPGAHWDYEEWGRPTEHGVSLSEEGGIGEQTAFYHVLEAFYQMQHDARRK